MDTKDYTVTQRAGRKVAGRVVPGPGATLRLTEAEAEHAVLAGELVPAGEELPAEFGRDSEVLEGMRADAERVGGRPRPGPPAVEPAPAASPAPVEAAAELVPPPAPAAPDAGTAGRRARTQPATEPAAPVATPPAA